MFVSRVFSRVSRNSLNHCRGISSSRNQLPQIFSNTTSDSLLVSGQSTKKWVPCQVNAMHNMFTTASQQFWYSSSASPQPNEKENGQETNNTSKKATAETKVETKVDDDAKAVEDTSESGSHSEQKLSRSESVKKRRRSTKRTAFSDSDTETETETDLSVEDLVKLVAEKEELLVVKQKEIEKMQDKVLRTYAEMENVMDRTKREADSSKKFAIQSFAKGLLDVADNLGRASSVVKVSFAKIDSSKDTAGAVPLLKTLLEGVEMTEKQLAEVFRKFGVEKFDPLNEQFDPNRHHALFQIPDSSKPSGTVAAVLKTGYTLYDRVIRPAEVGVTESSDGETEQSKEE